MAHRRTVHLLVWAFALSLRAASASTQGNTASVPPHRSRLLGVYDVATGEPIEGAAVIDLKSGLTARTTKTGTVSLIFLPEGESHLRVRKMGFEPIDMLVNISPADTIPMTMLLTSSATRLPAVVTTDSSPHYMSGLLRGFEERRKAGRGQFISEAELRKSDTRKMQDVVRRLSGIQIVCTRSGVYSCDAVTTRASSKQISPCKYALFIDGVYLSDTDLNKLTVTDYAGVEAYPVARIPQPFGRTGIGCGALLLWTRER